MAEPEPTPTEPSSPAESTPPSFDALGLDASIVQAVQERGYTEPTPIQARAIPPILAGDDVTGSAQTGTGKTAAFALPILQRLGSHQKSIRALVLEPTRELAAQVVHACEDYGRHSDLETVLIHGGVGYGRQREQLENGADIVVATPGRLLDHMSQRAAKLDDVEILVLDEVDRMLDMGFLPDVRRIIEACPKHRQTLLFSATVPPEIAGLAGWALKDPVNVRVDPGISTAATVQHLMLPVDERQKFELLMELLRQTEFKSVIIFSRTKAGADRIAHRLEKDGHSVGVLHADKRQSDRTRALEGFKSGEFELLVATDIVARGIDIRGVSHVINYNIPENPEDYVHRIGRTGRAQADGDAYTLYCAGETEHLLSIERLIGQEIPRVKLKGFDYAWSPVLEEKRPPTKKRRNRGYNAMGDGFGKRRKK